MTKSDGPHEGERVSAAGAPLDRARAALIMTHGRGATAESILSLATSLGVEDLAIFAPQAAGNTWYPYSFLSPIHMNEPGISSGIGVLADLVAKIETAGIPAKRIALLGFSQGACLTLEFGARHAQRYGAYIGLSGGLIGPDGTPRDYPGDFEGTPVFLGCSDVDPHIPETRVRETAETLSRMGANLDMRIYPGMGHTINDDEIWAVRRMLETVSRGGARV